MIRATAGTGLTTGDPYAAAQLFVGLAVFGAVVALSRQRNRAFSPAMVYLLMGVIAAALVRALGVAWFRPEEDAQVIERLSESP